MNDFNDLIASTGGRRSTVTAVDHQEGPLPSWKTYVEWDGQRGVIVSPPTAEATDGERLLKDEFCRRMGVNPEDIEIDGKIRVSSWDAQAPQGQMRSMFAYRANIMLRGSQTGEGYVATLMEEWRNTAPAVVECRSGDMTFVFNISDLQAGKGDIGGWEYTAARFYRAVEDAKQRITELRACGRSLGSLCLNGLGDLIESCSGHYAQQTFTTQLNERDQRQLATRLVLHAVKELAPFFPEVLVPAVGGNHGENRVNGKSHTDFGDNSDVEIFDNVERTVRENAAYEHVKFFIPYGELHQALKLPGGRVIGIAHGHQTGGGSTSAAKVKSWWEHQAFGSGGNGSVKEAHILFTGHFHHFQVTDYDQGRTHFQCPALDGGSKWFTDRYGVSARDGILTVVVTPDGYQDIQVL